MMERRDTAMGPFETFLSVSQIAHYVAVLPSTFLSSWTAQITGWRWPIMDGTQSTIGKKMHSVKLTSHAFSISQNLEKSWQFLNQPKWEWKKTYKWPTSWAATIMPLKPPVSSIMATELTFSRRLLTTQAPPTYAKPVQNIFINNRILSRWLIKRLITKYFFPFIEKSFRKKILGRSFNYANDNYLHCCYC